MGKTVFSSRLPSTPRSHHRLGAGAADKRLNVNNAPRVDMAWESLCESL